MSTYIHRSMAPVSSQLWDLEITNSSHRESPEEPSLWNLEYSAMFPYPANDQDSLHRSRLREFSLLEDSWLSSSGVPSLQNIGSPITWPLIQ
jgi:hypothetical protein